ncbi:DUF3022 domain-containing protein [Paraburkholderia sp. PREW-6R]|uniref:DUF3022 domain-containing protein n=1 Tax=Paraburkholderia sp. PREW-6R TaxID=3141544 RepID=UPI0031F55713
MNEAELQQRAEELELALANVFESPKAPAISSYDEGTRIFLQVSWVVESHADTTLDSRCAFTLALSEAQFNRYAAMDTAQRKAFQERLAGWAGKTFHEKRQNAPADDDDCAVEADVPETLFSEPQAPQ